MSRNWLAIRVWVLLSILITSLAGARSSAQGATVVRVDPSAATAQVNDTVSLSIKVDNVSNLTAFEVHLSFTPGVLEVTSLSNGGFVAADFVAQNIFDNAAGTIDYAVAQMNRPPAQGSGTLLTISFRAKAAGNSTLTTRPTQAAPTGLLLADQNGTSIQASWTPGSITVGSVIGNTSTPTSTSTPTPTSTTGNIPTTSTPTSTPTPTSTTGAVPTTSTPTSTPTSTLTPTSTPIVTPTPGGTLGVHVVRWGEWLLCIARAYRVSPSAIAKENRLWSPHLIFPGQKLRIPNVPWTNIPYGPACQAQFSASPPPPAPTPVPSPTSVPATPLPPASTATPTSTSTSLPPACRAYYTVRPGDNLYRIAIRYGTTYTEIARINQISNPRVIYPGQQLCIP